MAEWSGRGLQNLVQQFESAQHLRAKDHLRFFNYKMMTKYSRWIGLAGFVLLLLACFLPWTWHEDIQKSFTGFYSENNIYGRPAKFLLIAGGLSALFSVLPVVWLKRVALFMGAINIAYAFTVYIRFSSCYQGYCPEIKIGLPLMLFSTVLLFVAALFPSGKVKADPEKTETPPTTITEP